MKRVLVYSHDTFGLGNIRRMLEVVRHLVHASPHVSVLVVTGSPMLHAFRIPERVDYLKLPCLSRDVLGRYGARSLPLDLAQTVCLRANLLRSVIADFEPDLLLIDKKPFGVEDELAGALSDMPRGSNRPRMVLLLRDILDGPKATTQVWRKNGYFEAIESFYDEVLVVGSPEIFDLRHEYDFPSMAAAKVRYCGYIAREPGRRARAEVRADLGVASHEPLLLVTPGGGEDGHRLVATMLEGLAGCPVGRRPRTHVVCGPEMPRAQREAIEQRARELSSCVSVQIFADDMMSLVQAADVAVTMGGYNTVCELLACHRRAIVVPRTLPGEEQRLRAQRMATHGLLRWIKPETLTPEGLMAVVAQELDAHTRGVPRAHMISMNGLERVGEALLRQLDLEPEHHEGTSRDPASRDPASRDSAFREALTTSQGPIVAEGMVQRRRSSFESGPRA